MATEDAQDCLRHSLRTGAAPAKAAVPVSRGAELIAAERRRQVEVEGYKPEHDAGHKKFELTEAAIAYARTVLDSQNTALKAWWPWGREHWKPSDDPVRNLVKAGALIAAELDRLAAPGAQEGGADGNE